MDLTGGNASKTYRVRAPSFDYVGATGNYNFGAYGSVPYASTPPRSPLSGYGDRPYGELGKSTVSFFPYGVGSEGAKPPPPAFSGVPVLEQLASLGGELGKWGGRAVGLMFPTTHVGNLLAEKTWNSEAWANDPERNRLLREMERGYIDEYEAKSRFYEYRVRQEMEATGQQLSLAPLLIPPHDAGSIVTRGLELLWKPQQAAQRTAITPGVLDKLLGASEDELRGQDIFGNLGEVHQELVDIRNAFQSGEITRDEAIDELIISGFGSSLPSHPIHSLWDEIVTDPVNWLSLGIGSFGKILGGLGAKAVGRALGAAAEELGNEVAMQLIRHPGTGAKAATYFKELLADPNTARFAEKALAEMKPAQRVFIERFPMVLNLARRVENVLDPLTLFGGGVPGKMSEKYFAFQATQGVVDAFRRGTFLNINSAVGRRGVKNAEALTEEYLATATNQIVVQVGNEARIQKMLIARSVIDDVEGPVAAARKMAERYGTDITKFVRDKTEKVKRRFVPVREGQQGLDEMYATVRPRAARQVARIYKLDIDAATDVVAKMSDEELSLIDFIHYGYVVKEFLAARRAAGLNSPSSTFIDRLTFAGPHQMSKQDWQAVMDAIRKGDWVTVRAAVERFDDLRYNIRIDLSDAELREAIKPLMDKIKDWLPTTLKKKTLDKLPADMKRFIDEYGQDGYELLLRPEDGVINRAVLNPDGSLARVNPWVDYVDELSATKVRGRMNAAWDSVFRGISGTSIHRAAMHRFVRNAAQQWGIPEDRARGLFYAIEKAATSSRITVRGLTPTDMYKAALTVKLPDEVARKIGPRELAEVVVVSFEGSWRQVGVTQKLTGIAKSVLAPAGNWAGYIAENIFPKVRFEKNPFFQLQETIEAPFLMMLRGWYTSAEVGNNIKDFFYRGPGAKARREQANLLNEETKYILDRLSAQKNGLYAGDQIELHELALFGSRAAEDISRVGDLKTFPFSKWAARLSDVTGPLGIKRRAEARAFRKVYGNKIAKVLKDNSPESHRFMTEWYRARWAHPGGNKMADGEFFVQYLIDILGRTDPDSVFKTLPLTAMQPSHVGRRARTSQRLVRAILGVDESESWEALRRRAKDPNDTEITEDAVRQLMRQAGADDDYTERVLFSLFGWTADEHWDNVLKVVGPNTKIARRDVDALRSMYQDRAQSMGMSETEYLGRRFAGMPLSIDQFGNVKGKAYYQMLRDAFQLRGLKAIDAGSAEDMTFREFVQEVTPKFASQNEPWRAAPNGDVAEYADISSLEKYIEAEEFDPEVISRLADDIRVNGIEEPIVLEFAPGTSKVRVTDGLKRMAAAREAGLRRVPVFARRNDGLERGIRYTKTLPEDQLVTPSALGFRTSRTPKTLAEMSDAEKKHAIAADARRQREADPTIGAPVSGQAGSLSYGRRSFPDMVDEWERTMTEYERGEAARWYSDIRTSLLSLYGDPENARRALLGFAVGQRNTSPEDGFGYLFRGLEMLRRGEELPLDMDVLGKSSEQLRKMLLSEWGDTKGIGQKLMDFIDSLSGASTRSVGVSPSGRAIPWGPAAGDLWAKRDVGFIDEALFSRTPGTPAGGERIHALAGSLAFSRNADGDYVLHFAGRKRPDLGPDVEMVSTEQLWDFIEVDRTRIPKYPARGIDPDTGKKMTQRRAAEMYLDELEAEIRQNGITEPLIISYDPVTNTASIADGNHRLAVARRLGMDEVPVRIQKLRDGAFDPLAKVPGTPIKGGRQFQPIAGLRLQRAPGEAYFPGNPLPSELSFYGLQDDAVIPKAHVGTTDPTPVEYDFIQEYYNDFADYLNAENYMERSNWTAAEVQAVGWFRMKKAAGDLTGSTLDAVFAHKWDTPWEIIPGKGARLLDIIPGDLAPEVTEELNLYLMPHLQRLVEERTGVRVLYRFASEGTWLGTATPNINMEILGSPDAVDKALAYLGLIHQQTGMTASRLSSRPVALVGGKWNGNMHAMDWVLPKGATEAHAREVQRHLFSENGHAMVQNGGSQVVHYTDGRYGVRSLWMPEEWGDIPTAGGRDYVSGFTEAYPDNELILVKLDDFDEPAIPVRRSVESKYYENDWEAQPDGDAFTALLGADREGTSLADDVVRGDAEEIRDLADAFLAQRAGRERAINAAQRVAADGDVHFQRAPQGTLGATVTRADGKHQLYLSRSRNRDTFLHEEAHAWLQDLDPSGVRQLLDTYNAEVLARRKAKRPPRKYGHKMARTTQVANTDFHEWFANNFVEWVRTGDAPTPGLKPLFQHFNRALKQSRLRGSLNKEVKSFLDDAARVAPAQPYSYNVDEQTILDFAISQFRSVDRESKDLIYFKGERNLFERSLNHPYLGLYPLSYMWGKVLPELVEFLAFRPFGFQAPLLGLNVVNDIYKGVMLQQENDPELRAYLEKYEPALRSIGMMVPGLPWDLPVNAPLWVRRLSEAYSTNRLREMKGMDPLNVDVPRIVSDSLQYMFGPVQGTLSLTELGEGLASLGELAAGSVAGQIPRVLEPRTETPPLVPETDFVPVTSLPATLQQQDIYLQGVLSGQVSPGERPDNAVDSFVEEF